MSPFIEKTLGGLTLGAYIRHIILISPIIAFEIFILFGSGMGYSIGSFFMVIYMLLSTLLYPYARFAYESVVGYIMGDTIIIESFLAMLLTKIFTMLLCWLFAIFIAPIGLLCLYYYNTKYEKEAVQGVEMEKALYVEKKRAWEAEKAKSAAGEQ